MKKLVIGILIGLMVGITGSAFAVSTSTKVLFNKQTFIQVIDLACLGAISENQPGLSDSDKQLKMDLINKFCKRFLY